jgi:hypothetical protein
MPQDQDGDGTYAPLSVDISRLEAAASWLDGLSAYAKKNLIDSLAEVTKILKSKDTAFGTFEHGRNVAAKHETFQKAVAGSYVAISKDLATAATATRKILENYKSAEERNAANSRDIERIFGSSDPSSATGSSTDAKTSSSSSSSSSSTSGADL